MKKYPLVLSAILMASTVHVWAGHDDDQRIIDAAAKHQVTVAQAKKSLDETAVSVTGTIVRQIKHEHYELKDATGTIPVEIDEKLATAAQLKAGTKVKVIGEVDTHKYKPTDIDAVKVEFVK
ncbi:NirD/YgiW/YdeI family stress tolerance protein [Acinetobacter sp. ANC 3832]|uniref:NirD/YgiW/YdeI family stress tolerance protein n=1 Tax=Acinetobacter sp. ANC 3832 TaxID=1977874 RepID=UPI000A35B143|nr:NirD/YgiW/YdeI family stress tolerance protein [Acinetobacter sp. ANC 3832]OTG89509.1 DNA-binding protein [Acinetobacter sp. ANC 3832]